VNVYGKRFCLPLAGKLGRVGEMIRVGLGSPVLALSNGHANMRRALAVMLHVETGTQTPAPGSVCSRWQLAISLHQQAPDCGIESASMPCSALVNAFERPGMPSAPHILIAEDHPAVRDVFTSIVARTYPTCTITAVANGAEALAVYEAHGADLLITDYAMPIMAGLALIQTLRARQATIPILVLSMDTSIAEAVLHAGANRFLPKPFSLPELQQALIELLPP